MGRYYLGIDVGTGTTKAALVDASCAVVHSATVAHELDSPHPGWLECDAESVIWGDFVRLCHEVLAETGIGPSEIAGVGLSCMGCDCIAVDAEGAAIAPAILYGVDSRATKEIAQLNQRYGADAERVFGHAICSSDIAPKILWMRHHEPDVWQAARAFLTGSSYLCAKLTGEFVIDAYLAEDFLPMYDLATGEADPAGCEPFCRPDQLARIAAATDIAGTVTERAAAECGLLAGTPVLVGTGDSGAEAVSTGVFRPGDVMVQLGSSAYVICLADHMIEEPRLWPGTFIVPGTYGICAGTNTAGSLIRWLRDELYADAVAAEGTGGPNAFAVMSRAAGDIPAGSDGLVCLPYFAGERTPINDPLARGAFFGLTTNHSRAHLVRAAIEGICGTIAQIFDVLAEDGIPVGKVMCVGGGTNDETWLQCVADMLERPVHTAGVTIGAAYGDAIMAVLACGGCSSWEELASRVTPARTIEPRPETFGAYRRVRAMQSELYASTKDLAHEIARQTGGDHV